ncbi:MAG TPA: hypothetical protein VEL47_00225 [Myxococcota bacterium]|nr:hypothetical protein [Myxococcota bacterium]
MKVFVLLFLLLSGLSMAMDTPKEQKLDKIIRLNMGGYKFDTTLQTISESNPFLNTRK